MDYICEAFLEGNCNFRRPNILVRVEGERSIGTDQLSSHFPLGMMHHNRQGLAGKIVRETNGPLSLRVNGRNILAETLSGMNISLFQKAEIISQS